MAYLQLIRENKKQLINKSVSNSDDNSEGNVETKENRLQYATFTNRHSKLKLCCEEIKRTTSDNNISAFITTHFTILERLHGVI